MRTFLRMGHIVVERMDWYRIASFVKTAAIKLRVQQQHQDQSKRILGDSVKITYQTPCHTKRFKHVKITPVYATAQIIEVQEKQIRLPASTAKRALGQYESWDHGCIFRSSSRCSPKTCRLISRTASNPSRPLLAFWLNLSTLASSTLFLIFCQPPHNAVIFASWLKLVVEVGSSDDGRYVTVSRTLRTLDHVRFDEHIVTFFEIGST